MKKLKGLLFDVGGILLTIDYGILAAEAKNVVKDESPSFEHFDQAEKLSRPKLDNYLKTATSESSNTRRNFMTDIWSTAWSLAKLDTPGEPKFIEWAKRIEEMHERINLWRKAPLDAHKALSKLKQAGYVLGVVSNADGRVAGLLAESDLAKYFKVILDSHIEGVEKPNPEIFKRALERLELQAEETVFLGDFYSVDMVGARRAGLGATLMDPLKCWQVDDVPKVQSLTDYAERISEIAVSNPSPWV